MNKRQAKKNRTAYKRMQAKDKGIVFVNLKDVSPNSHIDVYISKKYETTEGRRVYNEKQGKAITCDPQKLKPYNYVVVAVDGGPKPFGMTVWVSDTDKSYYVIRPHREPEEGEEVITLEPPEGKEVVTL